MVEYRIMPHYYEGKLSGIAHINDNATTATPLYEISHSVGSVFQNPRSQFFNVDTTSEITFGNHPVMENAGKNFIFSYKNGAEILHQLDLYELKDLHPMSLSGGQKQRVAIATALAADKELLIFDEPTSGLDYRHMLQVADILKKLQSLGKSVYVITHDAELIMNCCTEMIRIDNGRLLTL